MSNNRVYCNNVFLNPIIIFELRINQEHYIHIYTYIKFVDILYPIIVDLF